MCITVKLFKAIENLIREFGDTHKYNKQKSYSLKNVFIYNR